MGGDIGQLAVDAIHDVWGVDADRSVRGESAFGWWPGRFRQVVHAGPRVTIGGVSGHVLSVITDVLRDTAAADPGKQSHLNTAARFAPSYAYRVVPNEFVQKSERQVDSRTLRFQCKAFVHEGNHDWLPKFVAFMALLQPIDAEARAQTLCERLGGEVDVSSPREDGTPCEPAAILKARTALYAPRGKEPSRWADGEEFEQFASRHERSDRYVARVEDGLLTIETPFRERTAVIRLSARHPFPDLGNGLFATLQLPLPFDESESLSAAILFNFLEAIGDNDFPLLGSWFGHEFEDGRFLIAHSTFVPNAIHPPGLASSVAHWMLNRSDWAEKLISRASSEPGRAPTPEAEPSSGR